MYRERPSMIPGAVRWSAVGRPGPATILPDGCMDIIVTPGGVIVAGPDAVAARVQVSDGAPLEGLRLPPGVLPQLLGVSASELVGARVDLVDILPHRRMPRTEAGDPETIAVALLDGVALDPRVAGVAASVRGGGGLGLVATAAGLGERALHRLSLRSFGYGPKTLARILRFQHAAALIHAGEQFAAVAASSGYADQAHMTREVRALAGTTPAQLRDWVSDAGRSGGPFAAQSR